MYNHILSIDNNKTKIKYMFPIRFNFFSSPSSSSWPQIMVKWLGHLWSYCTSHLSNLMQRVSGTANEVFSAKKEGAPLAEQDTPTPKSPVVEDQRKQEDKHIDPLNEEEAPTPDAPPGKDQIQPLPKEQNVSEPPQKIAAEGEEPNLVLEDLLGKSDPSPEVHIEPKADQPNARDPASEVPEGRRRRRRDRKKQPDQTAPKPSANNSAANAAKEAEVITPEEEAKTARNSAPSLL